MRLGPAPEGDNGHPSPSNPWVRPQNLLAGENFSLVIQSTIAGIAIGAKSPYLPSGDGGAHASGDWGDRSKVTASVSRGYAALRLEDDLGRDGTLAPLRRALERPMAIACLRLLCSPFLKWRISVSTSFCDLGPYLRRELDFDFDDADDLPRDDLRLLRDDDFFRLAIVLLP